MAKISTILVVCALLACMLVATESTVTCGQVASGVAPCLNYLRGGAPLSQSCCGGVKALNGAARTTPDRQAVCKCLKAASASIPGINLGLASGLPSKCGVNVPYKISPSTDCSR
ncbi:hypothetical protein CDL15_Pgr007671 [Punica granatum]|nr:hypothetical protein CDL15_Pgr007671 [Punica granatum]